MEILSVPWRHSTPGFIVAEIQRLYSCLNTNSISESSRSLLQLSETIWENDLCRLLKLHPKTNYSNC